MNLGYLLKILLRNKWIILGLTAASILLAFILTLKNDKVYKSTTLISTGFTFSNEINITAQSNSLFDVNNKFNNLTELMNSPLIVNMLSYNLLLHDLNNPKNAFTILDEDKKDHLGSFSNQQLSQIKTTISNRLENLELLSTNFDDNQDLYSILEIYAYDYKSLTKMLSIKRLNQSDYISVEFSSANPKLSEFAVNTISNECIRYNYYLSNSRSGAAVAYLEKMVTQAKGFASKQSDLLNKFKLSKNIYNHKAESEKSLSQVSDFENRKIEELKKIQELNFSLADINSKLTELADNPRAANNNKIFDLRRKIDALNDRYISGGSKEKSVNDQLAVLREQLFLEVSKQPKNNSKNDIDDIYKRKNQFELQLKISKANLEDINSALGNAKYSVSSHTNHEDTLSALERELTIANEKYDLAVDKLNEARKTTHFPSNNLRIVIFGQASKNPEPSKRFIIIALSGIISFSLCALVFILAEVLDMSIKTPSNFITEIDLPLLGFLNEVKIKNIHFLEKFKEYINSKEFSKYNQYLKNIRFEIESSKSKIFLISSIKKGEGKTFFILTISSLLQAKKKRVLIIDFDLKNNQLSNLSNKNKDMVINILSSEENLSKLKPLKILNGVDLIPCEQSLDSPFDIISSENWKLFLSEHQNNYDYIFIDSSPLNDFIDAKELIPFCEKIVVIFSAKTIIGETEQNIISYLKNNKNKILGGILNRVDELYLKK